jgi:hypothetical protein
VGGVRSERHFIIWRFSTTWMKREESPFPGAPGMGMRRRYGVELVTGDVAAPLSRSFAHAHEPQSENRALALLSVGHGVDTV